MGILYVFSELAIVRSQLVDHININGNMFIGLMILFIQATNENILLSFEMENDFILFCHFVKIKRKGKDKIKK